MVYNGWLGAEWPVRCGAAWSLRVAPYMACGPHGPDHHRSSAGSRGWPGGSPGRSTGSTTTVVTGDVRTNAAGLTFITADIGGPELELELIQSHMAQKPMLRGEVPALWFHMGVTGI